MKIRIRDRLFVSLGGLVLAASGAALIAQAYFNVDIASRVLAFIQKQDLMHMAVTIGVAAVLVLLGLYCFLMLFRHRKRRDKLVTQKTETGDLSITIKALEGLVQKCIDKHEEMHITDMSVVETRKGLVVRMRAGMSDNMNIPLAVGALQKQIKSYVSECSGLDVREVVVQVTTTAAQVKDSIYTVNDGSESRKPETRAEEAGEDQRPVHQRIFGSMEQPKEAPEATAEVSAAPETAPVQEAPVQEAPVQEAPVMKNAVTAEAPAAQPADEAPAAEEAATDAEEAADTVAEDAQEPLRTVTGKEVRLDDL